MLWTNHGSERFGVISKRVLSSSQDLVKSVFKCTAVLSSSHALVSSVVKRVVQYTQTESDGRRPWATRLTGSQFARDLVNIQQSIVKEGVENVGKRTPSDPMETACRGKNPSDCRESVRERLSKYTAKYS